MRSTKFLRRERLIITAEYEEIIKILREERERKLIPNQQLADKVGTRPEILSRVLNCKQGASVNMLVRIAWCLGVEDSEKIRRAWQSRNIALREEVLRRAKKSG
jgi:ribosome-binding protein aMBF1 (putative translation factor)